MIDLELAAPRPQTPLAAAPYHLWVFPDGTPWTAFYRTRAGFLLRFPELADFEISPDGHHVTCALAPNVSEATAEHLYLNQVLPLALSKLGKLVFHASAVEVAGEAIAFLAPSGRGKSTLAANFAVNGNRFLTDDGLVVEPSKAGYTALPSHASLRLWEDSHEMLLGPDAVKAPALQYTSKARFLAGTKLTHCNEPRPLRTVYFLGEGTAAEITFRRLSSPDALLEWTKHSFLIDIEDKALIGTHFGQIAALANSLICYHLDYPRRYEDLAGLRDSIVKHATSLSSAA